MKTIAVAVDETGRKAQLVTDGSPSARVVLEESERVQVVQTAARAADEVRPVSAFMSTNLNNKIECYSDLMYRILMFFGYPAVSVSDIHRDQIFEAISIACEKFTKYAGYTSECLVFDSRIYERDKGVRIDQLYTISSLEAASQGRQHDIVPDRSPDKMLRENEDTYVTRVPIPSEFYFISEKDAKNLLEHCSRADKVLVSYLRALSVRHPDGIEELSVINFPLYRHLLDNYGDRFTKDDFKKSKDKVVTEAGEVMTIYMEDPDYGRVRDPLSFNKVYDYDMMDYRKVISVRDYCEGSSTTMTSLFSFEAALASTAYFTYQFSLRGFDMVSFYSMHEWRKTREKLLGVKRDWKFDPRTQYFTLSPQPDRNTRFFSALQCYIEKPLRDIIKEQWVFEYALALCRIMLGTVRSKWGDGNNLLGTSGSLSGNAMAQQGQSDKERLEQMLVQKNGYGDAAPPRFFIG